MAIRQFDFIGVEAETSTLPTTSTPTLDTDVVTKGYADDTYTPRSNIYGKVSDITGLKGIGSSDRFNQQVAYVAGLNIWYEFDSASSSTPDDDLIVQPTSGTGRWLKIEGGGSSSGGGSSLETLVQKLDNEKYGIRTSPIDYSAGISGKFKPVQSSYVGSLLKQYTSGDSTIDIAWNPIVVNDSDKNFDTTSGWSAGDAAASLTTSATALIGTASVRFDKNGSNVIARMQYDRGSANLNISGNFRIHFRVNMPSVTNLSNIFIMLEKSGSDWAKWEVTTQEDGSAFVVGWNKIVIDVKNTAPTTTNGTGTLYTDAIRYVELGITTSSAGQTYTAVLFDSLVFSDGYPERFGVIGNEFTIYDTSVSRSFVVDAANTRSDGTLTLASSFASTIVGGISVTARGIVKRSSVALNGDSTIPFDNTSSLSGGITTAQEVRFGSVYRESVSKSYKFFIDAFPVQSYVVTTVGGSTIGVLDPVNQTANLLNGDTVDIFRPSYIEGKVSYRLLATRTLTAGASYSSPTTTLTLTTTSIAVGDIVVKRHITNAYISSVSTSTTNENFQALSTDASPNGVQLIAGTTYQNPESLGIHVTAGGQSDAEGLINRFGSLGNASFTKVGACSLQGDFIIGGRYSLTSCATNRFIGYATNLFSGAITLAQASCWVYVVSTPGSNAGFIGAGCDTSGTYTSLSGWGVEWTTSNTIRMITGNAGGANTTATSGAMGLGAWHHIFIVSNTGNQKLYVNGALIGSTTNTVASQTSDNVTIGGTFSQSSLTTNARALEASSKVGDVQIWRGGSELSIAQVQAIYNNGIYQDTLNPQLARYIYSANGYSGQKTSGKVAMARSTVAVTPVISKVGFIAV